MKDKKTFIISIIGSLFLSLIICLVVCTYFKNDTNNTVKQNKEIYLTCNYKYSDKSEGTKTFIINLKEGIVIDGNSNEYLEAVINENNVYIDDKKENKGVTNIKKITINRISGEISGVEGFFINSNKNHPIASMINGVCSVNNKRLF